MMKCQRLFQVGSAFCYYKIFRFQTLRLGNLKFFPDCLAARRTSDEAAFASTLLQFRKEIFVSDFQSCSLCFSLKFVGEMWILRRGC